jgi:NCAIR mutase (PurE)-related protein
VLTAGTSDDPVGREAVRTPVVNIDNGYGAACAALRALRR